MKACDRILRDSLMELMELDLAREKEALTHSEPHVFSAGFEQRMAKLFRRHKRRVRLQETLRHVAAAVLVVFLTGGIILIGSEEVHASLPSLPIFEWLEEYFSFGEGDYTRKEEEALFDESRIGYLPEGFEKVYEENTFSFVYYEYVDEENEKIKIYVKAGKSLFNADSDKVEQELLLNEAGFEYRYVLKDEGLYNIVIWTDAEDKSYRIEGTLDLDELIKVMNGITY